MFNLPEALFKDGHGAVHKLRHAKGGGGGGGGGKGSEQL